MIKQNVRDEGETNALMIVGMFLAASPILMLSPDMHRETILIIKWVSLVILVVAFAITSKICAKGRDNDTAAIAGILIMMVSIMFFIGAVVRLDRL